MRSNVLSSRWRRAFLLLLPAALVAGADAPPSGDRPAATPEWRTPEPVREPTVFARGVLCTGDFESHPVLDRDGRTIWFVKRSPDGRFGTIVSSTHGEKGWSIPVTAPFSGRWSDSDPHLAADGSRLWFVSERVLDERTEHRPKDWDVWSVERAGDGWSSPVRMSDAVNSPADESFPTVAADGTLYFASTRPGGRGGIDLYRSRLRNGEHQPAENLGAVLNTAGDERDPWIAPDQSWLVFAANRPGGSGGFDLYLARRRGSGWSAPVNLGHRINSPGHETTPHLAPDRAHFFWTSTRSVFDEPLERAWQYPELLGRVRMAGNGLGDLYYIDAGELERAE